jgi:hypothetical protein
LIVEVLLISAVIGVMYTALAQDRE